MEGILSTVFFYFESGFVLVFDGIARFALLCREKWGVFPAGVEGQMVVAVRAEEL